MLILNGVTALADLRVHIGDRLLVSGCLGSAMLLTLPKLPLSTFDRALERVLLCSEYLAPIELAAPVVVVVRLTRGCRDYS